MATLWNGAGHYIFALWFLLLSIFFLSSPTLSRRRLDVYHGFSAFSLLQCFDTVGWNPRPSLPEHVKEDKCSAVAEMGDGLATIDMGQKLRGCAPLGEGSWVPI